MDRWTGGQVGKWWVVSLPGKPVGQAGASSAAFVACLAACLAAAFPTDSKNICMCVCVCVCLYYGCMCVCVANESISC